MFDVIDRSLRIAASGGPSRISTWYRALLRCTSILHGMDI
jgi:hypothetical protein